MRRGYNPAFANHGPVLVPRQALPMGATMRGTSGDGEKAVALLLFVGVIALLVVHANKRWESYSPEERSDARKHQRQMAAINAARDVFD